ncbi:conserved hypothetical protein [Thermococcus onnurineus NA1]|uniref:RNA polymerase sigma factor 70 region 4 type 2 domain-containing protein n=1 Tax=Thermococcus onnurineus (strain NA1) TaxID=523850 RepID=B6YW52_THEON|nr:sigma-70 region 4 domain-containing protein [Thermococcus onnurineus]ACJ17418.1 conserved hypothetical protein [Thermococcus onnurineus NA1]
MLRLPEGMERIWFLRARGLSEAEIARSLGVSRQAVNKALRDARVKLFEAFFRLAETFSWKVVRINAEKGFAVFEGNCNGPVKVYALYIPGKGVRAVINVDFPDYILEHAVEVGLVERKDLEELVKVIEG